MKIKAKLSKDAKFELCERLTTIAYQPEIKAREKALETGDHDMVYPYTCGVMIAMIETLIDDIRNNK